jgi:hypothetical protein
MVDRHDKNEDYKEVVIAASLMLGFLVLVVLGIVAVVH